MPKWMAVILPAAVVLAGLAWLGLRDPAPFPGRCPACPGPALQVLYGAAPTAQDVRVGTLRVDGRSFDLYRHPMQGEYVAADSEIGLARTGFICRGCRRTWPVNYPTYPAPTWWGRFLGNLLRLL